MTHADQAAATREPAKMGSESEKSKVAIIGGGICGLALAVGLCKIPTLEVHVYEAVAEYKGTTESAAVCSP